MSSLQHAGGALPANLDRLFASDEKFVRWEDSVWLGLFFAGKMTEVLAEQRRVEEASAAGRFQHFLESAKGKGSFFTSRTLLRDLPVAVRRVCCVRLDGANTATGFLVGPDLVLTNWHVVAPALAKPDAVPARISVCFDFLHEAGSGTPVVVKARSILKWRTARAKYLPHDVVESDPALDYALVQLESSLVDRGFVDLSQAPGLSTGGRVVIVGHPNGRPMEVSFSRGVGLHGFQGPLAYYDADTLSGSSGSLVLLEHQAQLVGALLHAGGEPPVGEKNFGIHLQPIHVDIQKRVATQPAPPVGQKSEVGVFLAPGDEDVQAGRLGTLLGVLPDRIEIPEGSVAQQVESLVAQWRPEYQRALEIAAAVAAPMRASVIELPPPPPPPPPLRRPWSWPVVGDFADRRAAAYHGDGSKLTVIVAAVFVALAGLAMLREPLVALAGLAGFVVWLAAPVVLEAVALHVVCARGPGAARYRFPNVPRQVAKAIVVVALVVMTSRIITTMPTGGVVEGYVCHDMGAPLDRETRVQLVDAAGMPASVLDAPDSSGYVSLELSFAFRPVSVQIIRSYCGASPRMLGLGKGCVNAAGVAKDIASERRPLPVWEVTCEK
jgi:hypothetical protein